MKKDTDMKKLIYLFLCVTVSGFSLTACDDDETYAEQKEKERKVIASLLARDPLVLTTPEGDTLLHTAKIKVISQAQFEAQDSTTNVDENEYVLFGSTGIYMQIVRKGVGEKLKNGETTRLICRYWEYNILGDSLQTSDNVLHYATNPEILDVFTWVKETGTLRHCRSLVTSRRIYF